MSDRSAMPIFSVVIPIYKAEDYLRKTLESVLKQTFKSFEVICVNDETPDGSMDIVREYDDPRIRIVNQENRGLAGARNSGINASRGVFVGLLDADDIWHPRKLEQHFYHLQRDIKIGVSYSSSLFIDEFDKPLGIGQFPQLDDVTALDVFCKNPVGNGSSVVLRKSLLLEMSRQVEHGEEVRREFFDESLRQSEDVNFWLRIALTSNYKFAGIAEPLTYYRIHSGGLSANLERQYDYWLKSVEKNIPLNEQFFEEWFSLGAAYQKRYLARRAIKNGDPQIALKLINQSIGHDARILLKDPKKTIITYACALLSFLPKPLFQQIMKKGMSLSSLQSGA
ncbi:MAG: glycosyltransferase family 2 protein [Pseudomonadales bacterium]|nr:glycosyltransferase family 2 protein [Pseudomonadales bacterium]